MTGAAGFLGHNLIERLDDAGVDFVPYDLKWGGDIFDAVSLHRAMKGADIVFHLAANADVRYGFDHPRAKLSQNLDATLAVLEAMLVTGVKRIVFSSTGSVYGRSPVTPTPEDAPFPIQTSVYGAAKLASEALIQAYCEGHGFQAWIYRLVALLGERYAHGHVVDFYRKLQEDPTELTILGDGRQQKSYLYVNDCIDGMLCGLAADSKVNIFNLGTEETLTVNQSAEFIASFMNVRPQLIHTGGDQGWAGDNPIILLDISRMKALGWKPNLSIKQGILKTLHWLQDNDHRP